MEKLTPGILRTRPHFEILDGLRGIAAISVVVFHFMEVAYSDYSQNFIGHGFLAVDFFFCLSGFVIAYAYDDRIGKMGLLEFFKSRIIRLHPLVILGSVIGLLGFFFDPFSGHSGLHNTGRIALIFITSVFLIPFPVMTERYYNLFSFNAPAWSLFWEYVANIFYALILCRLKKGYLVVLLVISAVMLFFTAHHAGNLMGGWSGGTFWDGGARISYSFLAGMLVYRFNWIIKNKLGFIGVSILLAAAFLSPFSNNWNWLTEPLIVILYFPLIIALGAGSLLRPRVERFCVFAGKISYPLYMTHYAFIWVFASYFYSRHPNTRQLTLVIISGLTLLILFAWLVMTVYDIPVRRYLNNRRKQAAAKG